MRSNVENVRLHDDVESPKALAPLTGLYGLIQPYGETLEHRVRAALLVIHTADAQSLNEGVNGTGLFGLSATRVSENHGRNRPQRASTVETIRPNDLGAGYSKTVVASILPEGFYRRTRKLNLASSHWLHTAMIFLVSPRGLNRPARRQLTATSSSTSEADGGVGSRSM